MTQIFVLLSLYIKELLYVLWRLSIGNCPATAVHIVDDICKALDQLIFRVRGGDLSLKPIRVGGYPPGYDVK